MRLLRKCIQDKSSKPSYSPPEPSYITLVACYVVPAQRASLEVALFDMLANVFGFLGQRPFST